MFTSIVLLSALVGCIDGHGALLSPRSRNSVDYLVGVNVPKKYAEDRECVNITGAPCENGQAAFWYSQGCFIGCPACDHLSGRRQTDLCGLGKKATLNDPAVRSVNRGAAAGSPQDIYRHNPWRAPGTAPVANACGLAGGTPWPGDVSEAGVYTKTKFTHHGMAGTALAPLQTGTVWTIGGLGEVTWGVENNHGGGYSYRLCPAGQPITEECFQSHQLEFDTGKQGLVFKNGSVMPVRGVFITEGTFPEGSMWARLPLPTAELGPRCLPGPNDTDCTPNKCEPWERINIDGPCVPCPETPGSDCSRCDNTYPSPGHSHSGHGDPSFQPPCEGCEGNDRGHAIRDFVKVPTTLEPGKYVLSWRWDCEASAQVWSNCADITLARGEDFLV